ncbi:uncharacterized protein LOC123551574 isoform X2 [Mercenaria mercenaria]|uniref:uncharacterized protein LOC123551574 isoform X2 n=1 Tax=Mercenaria mercenaria TaxID=6596 RepID=UPI00234ED0E6|nr:uncharacterized protein LOC123551574 isoform X2 [Mercenaria mercenaria]
MTLKRQIFVYCLHTIKSCTRGLSSKSKGMDVESVHKTAQEGFKQGDHYDRNRPSYSDELAAHVIKSLHGGDHKDTQYDILELGAGTGKFTRKILEALKGLPMRYIASEPSEGFLSVLRQQSPTVETLVGSAMKIPLPEQSVMNVICAQSFHWFATKESLAEIQRVLVPGGRLVLVWNDKDWNIEWLRKLEDVLTLYYDDTPRKITGKWKNVFDGCPSFRCVEHRHLAGITGMKGDKNFVLNHFTSISVIARLDPQQRQEALEKFKAVLDEAFTDDEEIDIPFKSDFYCTEKIVS